MNISIPKSPYPGYPFTTYKYHPTFMYVPMFAYPEAIQLILQSVSAEKEDDLFYSFLLKVAPEGQKEIVASIRDDELKHFKMLRQIYWEVTGQEIPQAPEVTFQEPGSFCEGIQKALFGELSAVERYRKILFGFEFLPYRNMITEIYTDELKHGVKWNFLYSLNCIPRSR
ncbi:ferritin-like domain-containing protein [Heliobacterium mobile]|uniref:ferritin-like domain-containing protein n=1 Tax=Heliobacterium mobile TaxID=28064 RepID=UPI001A9AF275|nr:ferritin-like domain-containing protein [Heliobacterium mobile]